MSGETGWEARGRVAGVTVPLFSLRSAASWGIGEIGDLPGFAEWVAAGGIGLVQILPLGEISGHETSPYGAMTAFGIDPLYVSYADVPDLDATDPEALRAALGDGLYAALDAARSAPAVDYEAVRAVKARALAAAHARFARDELAQNTRRAADFRAFVAQHAPWIDDYALFRALKDVHGGAAWWDWPAGLRDRDDGALAAARAAHAGLVGRYQYAQWLAHVQWDAARATLNARGTEVMGDLPFMVGRDSADVWANRGEFRQDAVVGVPGDQFNEEGQDWGLPPYDWAAMRASDFAWLRRRVGYAASLYDRFRIDHLVGFYRTYMRALDRRVDARGKLLPGFFDPGEEPAQKAHGERVLGAMLEAARAHGAELVAEDLGTIPDFVRPSLASLGVPGYKVLIWEKDWKAEGEPPFIDPPEYPPLSVACFGTHDTDAVAVWWETREAREREAIRAIPTLREHADRLSDGFTPEVHRALCDLINASGSALVLFLMQDVLGTRERVNTPATTGPRNWTYRLPAPVERLRADPATAAVLAMLRASVAAHGRLRG